MIIQEYVCSWIFDTRIKCSGGAANTLIASTFLLRNFPDQCAAQRRMSDRVANNLYMNYIFVQVLSGRQQVTPLEKLIAWHESWALRNQTVKCKGCGAEQSERDRALRFTHESDCPNARFGAEPWQALDEVRDAYWIPPKGSSAEQDADARLSEPSESQ
ncbi:hypothetical protein ACLEJQ_24810 [Pseudomonas sp. SMV71]|uniref:hypothetical protein n=1 Tax=Pseudomonas sp. SMV71 TaxID=3390195 RepID=UPI003F846664